MLQKNVFCASCLKGCYRVLAGRAFFLLTAKETKLPARNYSYSLYIFSCIHEGYAVFLLKLVSRLGQCHPKKLTMSVQEQNEETVVWLCQVAITIVLLLLSKNDPLAITQDHFCLQKKIPAFFESGD